MDRKIVISSLFFKFIERFAVKGIGLCISIILARLLAPEDFGQVAIISVFINLSYMLIHSGFSSALVQKKETREIDYSTVFYIYIAIAAVLVVLLWIFAPTIGRFYKSDITMPLRIYSVSLLFGALSSVQVARMQKRMQFKLMMFCNLAATVISGALGIVLAHMGAGIWALIAYYSSNVVITSAAMLLVERWLPISGFSVKSAKELFGFGWKMLVSALLTSIYSDVRSLIIGKKFSTEDLGYYTKGQQFPNIMSHSIDGAIQSVMFPTLANIQNSNERIKAVLSRSVTMGAMIVLPMMVGFAVVAEPFVRIFLTEKWLPCVAYMQIFCFAEANIVFTSSNMTAIKAMGRSDLYMKLEIVRRAAMVVVLVISVCFFGTVKAIALGYLISAWIDVVIITSVMKKLLNYGFFSQIRDNLKVFVTSAIMGVVVYAMSFIHMPTVLLLVVQIVTGIVVYCALSYMIKAEGYMYAIDVCKGLKKRKK